jgi:rSAM/selenodomain-associated transferase 1
MVSVPSDDALIIFLRLPEKGKVKTRLAATVGEEMALHIYKHLVSCVMELASSSGKKVYLFFKDALPPESDRDKRFSYHIQSEGNLGMKMANALSYVLNHHDKAVVIGSDCPELSLSMLEKSYSLLEDNTIVIGPAQDGGYYLLGCKKAYPSLFEDISWSTSSVLRQTIEKIKEENLSYLLLDTLSDIDSEEDWKRYTTRHC